MTRHARWRYDRHPRLPAQEGGAMTTAPLGTFGPCGGKGGPGGNLATREQTTPAFGQRSGNGTPKQPDVIYLCQACYELDKWQASLMYGADGDEMRHGVMVRG